MRVFLWGMFLYHKRPESIVRDMKREFPDIGTIYWDWIELERAKYHIARGETLGR